MSRAPGKYVAGAMVPAGAALDRPDINHCPLSPAPETEEDDSWPDQDVDSSSQIPLFRTGGWNLKSLKTDYLIQIVSMKLISAGIPNNYLQTCLNILEDKIETDSVFQIVRTINGVTN
jgi:hypothetical protein